MNRHYLSSSKLELSSVVGVHADDSTCKPKDSWNTQNVEGAGGLWMIVEVNDHLSNPKT